MGILVVGSMALDSVKTPFGEVCEALGGSATYFSLAASYFGAVQVVGVVGSDFPQAHLTLLRDRGVDLAGVQVGPGKTFRWSGEYGYDLGNPKTLATHLNVFEEFMPELPSSYRRPDLLFLANIDPDLQRRVIEQCERPHLIAMDTMNFWIQGRRDALMKTLALCDLLTINESEARLLADQPNLVKAARQIRTWGPKTLLIKQGEYGALLFQEDAVFSAPAMPLEAIYDPTGAGDTFAGGFMGYLAREGDLSWQGLKKATIYGSVMASFVVEKFSVDRLRDLTAEDIAGRYQEFRHLAHFDEGH